MMAIFNLNLFLFQSALVQLEAHAVTENRHEKREQLRLGARYSLVWYMYSFYPQSKYAWYMDSVKSSLFCLHS